MECKDCQSKLGMAAMSFKVCEECYIECISGTRPGFKLCINCSMQLKECRRCRKKIEYDR
jgi:hypothetical protein